MNQVVDFINVNRDRYVDELKQYLAIPSISALPEHAGDVRRAAEWTADACRTAGLENVKLVETPGNPVVYADWLHAPGKPTILFYGHYDVQPVDPVNLWTSPPFEATVRDLCSPPEAEAFLARARKMREAMTRTLGLAGGPTPGDRAAGRPAG